MVITSENNCHEGFIIVSQALSIDDCAGQSTKLSEFYSCKSCTEINQKNLEKTFSTI